MFKTELDESTVIACLAGRDAQEVLYTGFACPNTERRFKAITILARHLQCQYPQDLLFGKNIIIIVKPVLSGHHIKRTPSIKLTVAEVAQFFSLIFFK